MKLMGFRTSRKLLGLLSFLFIATAAGLLAVGFLMPVDAVPSGDAVRDLAVAAPSADSRNPVERLGPEKFVYVWKKPLQRPLVDPPPPQLPAEVPRAPAQSVPFTGVLVGTLIDSNTEHSRAWFRFGNQPNRAVQQGQILEDLPGKPQIVSIEQRQVLIRLAGRELVLDLEDGVESRLMVNLNE